MKDNFCEACGCKHYSSVIADNLSNGRVTAMRAETKYSEILKNRESKSKVTRFRTTVEDKDNAKPK